MIVDKLRQIVDLYVGDGAVQAVYVVKEGVYLVWRRMSRVFAWFHDIGWHRDKGWFHN